MQYKRIEPTLLEKATREAEALGEGEGDPYVSGKAEKERKNVTKRLRVYES